MTGNDDWVTAAGEVYCEFLRAGVPECEYYAMPWLMKVRYLNDRARVSNKISSQKSGKQSRRRTNPKKAGISHRHATISSYRWFAWHREWVRPHYFPADLPCLPGLPKSFATQTYGRGGGRRTYSPSWPYTHGCRARSTNCSTECMVVTVKTSVRSPTISTVSRARDKACELDADRSWLRNCWATWNCAAWFSQDLGA